MIDWKSLLKNQWCPFGYPAYLLMGLGVLILLLWWTVFQSASLINNLGMSHSLFLGMMVAVPMLPVFCLFTWKNTRLCLVLYTLLLIFGDALSALSAFAMIAITLPNFLYLVIRWRMTRLKYLVAPLVVLGVLYFFTAFLTDVIAHPVQLTNRMQFDPGFPPLTLGGLGSMLGFTIVYPLIYTPYALYDISKNSKTFRHWFIIGLSIVINLILLYGAAQYIQAGGDIRVSSIMRLPTRLGPFIDIYLALAGLHLLEAKQKSSILYWLGSTGLAILVLFMTQTRVAIIALALLAIMLFISMVTSRNKIMIRRFLIGGLMIGLLFVGLHFTGKFDFLARFDSSQVESGHSSRHLIMEDYKAGANLENVTGFQKISHFLFGFGVFREREFAHFNLHDTVFCCFSAFGAVGLILYFLPYLTIAIISMIKTWTAVPLLMRPRYAMAFALILIFFLTGSFHNKLYSPIDTAFVWLIAGLLVWDDLPFIFTGLQKGMHKREYYEST